MAQLSLTKKSENASRVVFGFPGGTVRFARRAFGADVPEKLVFESDAFAERKPVLTAEERKAARKNAPKLTPAQKLAKLNERAARLQAKIAAEAAGSAEI